MWLFAQPNATCRTWCSFSNVRFGGTESIRVMVGSEESVMATIKRYLASESGLEKTSFLLVVEVEELSVSLLPSESRGAFLFAFAPLVLRGSARDVPLRLLALAALGLLTICRLSENGQVVQKKLQTNDASRKQRVQCQDGMTLRSRGCAMLPPKSHVHRKSGNPKSVFRETYKSVLSIQTAHPVTNQITRLRAKHHAPPLPTAVGTSTRCTSSSNHSAQVELFWTLAFVSAAFNWSYYQKYP